MVNSQSIKLFIFFFFLSFTSYAQHGSGGAGALGGIVILLTILGVAAFFAIVLLIINILAYLGKAGRKSITMGIFISIVFVVISFWFIVADASMVGYTLFGVALSLGSTFHLISASKKLKAYEVGSDEILDDVGSL